MKRKKAKRSNTFMPDIHSRKHPILGLPNGKIDQRVSGKPYLPVLVGPGKKKQKR
jgi:hypothetical protein